MSLRTVFLLLVIGFIVAIVAALGISVPGYMDAEYYFVTGLELSQGHGFQEPFIWNYFNAPSGIPHASHGYWMPLSSLLVALSTSIAGASFRIAQLPYILLFALLPLLTAQYSLSVNNDESAAFQSGLLAAVPGFFLPYFLTTDMFILYAWVGTLFFWSCCKAAERQSNLLWVLSGVFIGLAHLARADGLLFIIPLIYLASSGKGRTGWRLSLAAFGYLLIMTPWFIRNVSVYGAVMPPGTQLAIWLRSYEDLFHYPASDLGPGFLLQVGLPELIQTRISALSTNIQRVIAENGLVFLLPLMLIGIYEKWDLKIVKAGSLFWACLLLVMSFVFPFAGAQGGIFHSSAALMPTLWMLVPFGLRKATQWVGSKRGWNVKSAARNFAWIFIALAVVFTGGVYLQRVFGLDRATNRWSADTTTYQYLGEILTAIDSDPGTVVVNNPPGFYAATGLPAVVVPSGGEQALKQVVEKFNVGYVILDRNHPTDIAEIYEGKIRVDFLKLVDEVEIGSAAPIRIYSTQNVQDDS